MRWKLLRRRLSVSAPRMIVRSHLPWPLRWAVVGLALGFSAALALWAFEFGKEIAGLDRGAKQELTRLRTELEQLRKSHERAQAVANSADTLLRAEHAAQERLAEQVRSLELEKADLSRNLAFFENLLPVKAGQVVSVRGFQANVPSPGRLHYQLIVMRAPGARDRAEFQGRYEFNLSGTLEGRPWSLAPSGRNQVFAMKQFQRLEGAIDYPPGVVVRQVSVKVFDGAGALLATEAVRP